MASTLVSTLYPPLVDTFMPAFVHTKAPKIAFSLSPYNTEDKIKRLHVTVVDQTTNQNVLDPTVTRDNAGYITEEFKNTVCLDGVLIIPFDNNRVAQDKETGIYAIDIPLRFLKAVEGASNKEFKVNQYYKVQLRFDSTPELQYMGKILSSDYLLENRQYFSEWSSVCLIRPIEDVSLYFNGFERADLDPTYPVPFAQGYVHLVGELRSEYELLQSYRFKLKDASTGEMVVDTGLLYPNPGSNQINYLLGADNTIPGCRYKLIIDIVTKNQYTLSKSYYIQIAEYDTEYAFDVKDKKIFYEENIEDGSIKLKIATEGGSGENYPPGKMYVKRASSRDNFKTWELLSCTEHLSSGNVQGDNEYFEIIDNTVASMVQYKYSAQFWFKGTNSWSQPVFSDIIYPTFYDIILSRNNTQLAIRYNGQLTSVKPITQRAKFDTLGSKYPKFAENAHMNYKQYSLSGLICAEGDFNRKFISELDEPYKSNMEAYDKAFGGQHMLRNDTLADGVKDGKKLTEHTLHDTYPHQNWYWERTFRDEVVDWLNDGEAKLFRSMPEGNMIVMVTDVSLTPNQQIGRMLYNFTATLYEVGDGYSLSALDAARVVEVPNPTDAYALDIEGLKPEVGDYFGVNAGTVTGFGQLELDWGNSGVWDESKNIINPLSLRDRFINSVAYKNDGVRSTYKMDINSLVFSNIQIQFTSKPKFYTSSLEEYNDGSEQTASLFGYVIMLDGSKRIFVNERGYYKIPSTVTVTELEFIGCTGIISFIATYNENIVIENTPDYSYKEKTIIGQLPGLFFPDEWLGEKIKERYSFTVQIDTNADSKKITQEMNMLKGASFELTPYSLIDILYEDEKEPVRIMVGRTGVYHLSSEYNIEDIRVAGVRMVLNQQAGFKELDPWEYRLADNSEGPEDLGHRNTVYDNVLYYNGQPYEYIQESDNTIIAKVPVEGYITYTGDILQDIYTEVQQGGVE